MLRLTSTAGTDRQQEGSRMYYHAGRPSNACPVDAERGNTGQIGVRVTDWVRNDARSGGRKGSVNPCGPAGLCRNAARSRADTCSARKPHKLQPFPTRPAFARVADPCDQYHQRTAIPMVPADLYRCVCQTTWIARSLSMWEGV
eukprot:6206657-Pleurochrysis_carterae.AAC.6